MMLHINQQTKRQVLGVTTSYMNYASPDAKFAYDVNQSPYFKKDAQNYINVLGVKQLNTLGNSSLLDIYLSKGNTVEPHIHQNANELVYVIQGGAIVSLINPFTNQLLNYTIKPGQVVNIPQGWWHYETASEDQTHLLAIFDAPQPEAIFGSDILRLTPPDVWAHSYCLDVNKVKDTFAPITKTVIIGPPADCQQQRGEYVGEAGCPQPYPNVQPSYQNPQQPSYPQQVYCPYHQQYHSVQAPRGLL